MTKDAIKNFALHIVEAMKSPQKRKQTRATRGARNACTGRKYRGCNTFLLSYLTADRGYAENKRATFKQISQAGGHVKKGEKGTIVFFWDLIKTSEKEKSADVTEEKHKVVHCCKTFLVFNQDQVDGATRPKEPIYENEVMPSGQSVINTYLAKQKIPLAYGDPAYRPSIDTIAMPGIKNFVSSLSYYATFFHEMIHSTGHEKRLARQLSATAYNKKEYSKEELVAEFGSCFLLQEIGATPDIEQSASYLASRAKLIAEEQRYNELITAIGKAQTASEYVLL